MFIFKKYFILLNFLFFLILLFESCSSNKINDCNCGGQISLKNVSKEDCNKICNALNHNCENYNESSYHIDCDTCLEECVDIEEEDY